jgi:hypothetical protein
MLFIRIQTPSVNKRTNQKKPCPQFSHRILNDEFKANEDIGEEVSKKKPYQKKGKDI